MLVEMMSESDLAVGLYDPRDELCWANACFERLFLRGLSLPVPFADVLRHGFRNDFGVRIDCGDVEAFLRDILPRRRTQRFRSMQVDTVDNTWIWMTETLTPSGYLLSVGADISSLKHEEVQLREAHTAAFHSSITDDLTGAPNRRHILNLGEAALLDGRRHRRPVSLAVLDIDHFKQINDRLGHDEGDAVLRRFYSQCRAHLRPGDLVGRVGGEEFLVLFPGTSCGDAGSAIERLRRDMDTGTAARFTFSAGLAEANGDESLSELIKRADAALYRAKGGGRNRSETD